MADFDPNLHVSQDFDPKLWAAGQPEQPKGGMISSAVKGIGQGALEQYAKPIGLAAAVPAMIGDKIRNAFTGQTDTTAQDFVFKNVVDTISDNADKLAPSSEEASSVSQSVAHGLGYMASALPVIALSGGKMGVPAAIEGGGAAAAAIAHAARGAAVMAPIAAAQGINQTATAARAGVDLPTAYESGLTQAAIATATGAVPLAMRGGILTRAATGAASGAITGEIGREAQNAVLGDYQNLQTPFTTQGIATQAATGALLGAALGPRAYRPGQTPEEIAARQQAQAQEAQAAQQGQLFDQYRQQFMEGVNGVPEEAPPTGLSPVEQGILASHLDQQVRPEPEEPAPFYGRDLDAELNVMRTMDELTRQEQARQAAVENAKIPANVPKIDEGLIPKPVQERAPTPPAEPSQNPVSERLNTQIQDALMEAQRRNGGGKAATQAAFEAAEAQRNAQKEQELTAIQNIAKGETLAEQAARGEVPANAKTLAAPVQEFQNKLADFLPEGSDKLPPRLRQEVAQIVSGKQTYDQQLDALSTLRDQKNQSTVSYAVLDKMVKDLRPEPAPEVQPQVEAPAETQAPAAEAKLAEQPATVKEAAQAAADRLDATVAELNSRDRAGQLADNERPRLQEAQDLRRTLARALASGKSSDEYLSDLTKFADNTATQEAYDAQGPLLSFKAPSPDEPHLGLARAISQTKSVQGALDYMKTNGSEQWVKDLAGKLSEFGIDVPIHVAASGGLPGEVGRYDSNTRAIQLFSGGASEHTALHEIIHSALFDQMDQASRIFAPRNQTEAAKVSALRGLDDIRKDALKRASAKEHYGLTNVHEFVAELNTNPKFQDFLSQKSLWQKTVAAVRKMIGMPVDAQSQLEKALSLQGEFFGKEQYQAAQEAREAVQRFDSSPAEAAKVTDEVLPRLIQSADDENPRINLGQLTRQAFNNLLQWKTTQFIVDRAGAVPELVKSGFHEAAQQYVRAYTARNLASEYAGKAPVKYGSDLEHYLRKQGDNAAALNKQAADIGIGSSIWGFDPTKNFADNQKAGRELAPSSKAFVDSINRKFTQLKSTNPELAQAIIDGSKVNRKGYVLDHATIVSNLLRAAGDTARRLAADLQQMAPEDARRAEMEARAEGATAESNFAVRHGTGLDFMAKDVQDAKNTNPALHIDGASDILDKRLRAVFSDANSLPKDSTLRQQLKEFEGIYANQIENPYYHAGRSGDYFMNLKYRDMDQQTWDKMQDAIKNANAVLGDFNGNDHAFIKFNSLEEAAAAYKKLTAAAGSKYDGGSVGALAKGGQIGMNAPVSAAMRSALQTLHDSVTEAGLSGPQAAQMQEALTRKFMSMLPETSTRLAKLNRAGVPGYTADFLGSFGKRASGAVRDTANIYSMRAFSESLSNMDKAVEDLARGDNPDAQAKAQAIADEIKTRYYNGMKPVENNLVNLVNSLGHSFFLAMSPAYLIRATAQPFHRGLPITGARYGFVNAAKELGSAYGPALRVLKDSLASGWAEDGLRGAADSSLKLDGATNLSAGDRAFLQEANDRGILKLGQARQLQQLAIEGNVRTQDLVRLASMTVQASEILNRMSIGLSAFRLAEKAGKASQAENIEYALKTVANAMDDFNPDNMARGLGKYGPAGKITPLISAFQQFNFQTMQQIARTVQDGFFNKMRDANGNLTEEGAQRVSEARREFAGLMGTTALISGALGLPFVNAFAGVYNTAANLLDPDNPTDIRIATRNWLANQFGADVGGVIAHGLPHEAGVDTSTFGLQDLSPGSSFLSDRRLLKDKIPDYATQMWGPSINAGINIFKGLNQVVDGQYMKGIEQMLPSGIKGAYKAYEASQYGYTDSKGNPIGLPVTGWDLAVQSAGLRPADRAEASEAAEFFNINQDRINARRSLILDNFYKGVTRRDPALVQSASQMLKEFNRANPLQPITDINGAIQQRIVAQAVGAATGTGIQTTARRVPVIQQDIQFTGNNTLPRF